MYFRNATYSRKKESQTEDLRNHERKHKLKI